MLTFYVYFILILVSIFLFVYGITLSLSSPIKIRILGICISIGMILRYIVLILMFLCQNVKGLYSLKPLFFLNLLLIPAAVCVILYIFARNEKIKFNIIFILGTLFLITYIFIISRFTTVVEINGKFGYIINFTYRHIIEIVYFVYNIIFLFLSIFLLNKKGIIKMGVFLVLISSALSVTEVIASYAGIILLPQRIVGDFLWTITFIFALNEVKK